MMRLIALLVLVAALGGCRVQETAPWPPTASMAWGNGLAPTETIPDARHFEYQLTSVTPEFVADQVAAGRTLGLYVPADAVHGWMALAREGTWASDWYRGGLLRPAPAAGGGPWSPWPGATMVDVADPAARRAMVAAVQAHLPPAPAGRLGLMLDYMTVPRQSWGVGAQDPLDLDRDGVPHQEDLDEQSLLRASYEALLGAYRDALPGVALSANGTLALRDTAVTALLDGIFIEGSGAYWPWWNGRRGVEAMLHPDNPGNWQGVSRHLRPGWTSVMECKDEGRHEYAVALAMMLTTDEHPVVGVAHEGARPASVDHLDGWWVVGRPTGEMMMTQPGLYARAFEGGIAELRIVNDGGFPNPFSWKLRTYDGEIIAEMGEHFAHANSGGQREN